MLRLSGNFRITENPERRRTEGKFSHWMESNDDVLREYFGVQLAPGSLNIDITQQDPTNIHRELDLRRPPPTFSIPPGQLRNMADYLGDAQVWRCRLFSDRIPGPHPCWVLRRIGSRVPDNVVEVVSTLPLAQTYGLRDADAVTLELY